MAQLITLCLEELKATMRGRFAWLGAAVILVAVGGLATVATQDSWLDGYGIVAYGLVPLGVIPLAAGFIAAPRANRFVESVFTAPVNRRDWLIAKIFVLLTLAVAYYIALLPMLFVYLHHVGLPFLLGRFLLWTPGILLSGIAIGTLIGVLFIGRSVAPPAGVGMGVLLAWVGLVPLQELMVARGNGATRSGHVALASPAVLLKNALGFTLATASIPATTTFTWISFVAIVIAAFVLAVWIFLRAQGVETWEATRRQRWIIAAVIAAIVLLPVLLADTNYDNPAPAANLAPPLRGIFARAPGTLALVPSGGPLPARCCSPILTRQTAPLGTDEPASRDLLILLTPDTTPPITGLSVHVAGEGGLRITAAGEPKLETSNGWIARLPVTLLPTRPWDIGGNRYPLAVTATWNSTHTFSARGAIEAQVPGAIYEMGAAASVLPLLCLIAAFRRWWRTR